VLACVAMSVVSALTVIDVPSAITTTRATTAPVIVVNAPVVGVVAPTVPLMLMDAVPVKFVTVPEDGVPNAPPLTTGEPAVPILTAKAVATPVPRPLTPVLMGRPVAFVKVTLVGVPRIGVTNVGVVAKTKDPEPVSSVTAEARLADDGVPRKVATPVPSPDTPVEIGRPVAFVNVADVGVPRMGVTRVGLVANTKAPVPVSSVTAEARFALEGVAKNVATPVPKPETPVEIGRPVTFVIVPEEGVPSAPPSTTGDPAVPTLTASAVATPVPRPDTPVAIGNPVALVSVADVGVPRMGVTNVGLVANTKEPVPVSSVTAAARLADEGVPRKVATPVPKPDTPVEIGKPVALVNVTEVGVPRIGVTSVGLVDMTTLPVPVIALLTSALVPLVKTA